MFGEFYLFFRDIMVLRMRQPARVVKTSSQVKHPAETVVVVLLLPSRADECQQYGPGLSMHLKAETQR